MNSSSQSSLQPTTWLITGGCGFIGTALIQRLVKQGGHQIRVLDNLSVGNREDLARVCGFVEIEPPSFDRFETSQNPPFENHEQSPVELIVGDITDPEICTKSAANIEIIVHLAANTGVPQSLEEPRKDMEANVVGTFNMMEAARKNDVKRFVFASSGAPIGECTPPIHEEMPCHPVSPYGASKLAGEAYCSAFFRSYGLETVALRFGNVYGPGSTHKNSVVAKFIKQAMEGGTLEIYGDGSQTRDFIFIDDLTDAIMKAAKVDGVGGEVFQIATNRESTVNELVDLLIPALRKLGIEGFKVLHGPMRKGDVKRNFSDTKKAKEKLFWEVNIGLTDGIVRTVSWFLK